MLGTLYGTLEVAPPVLSEAYRLINPHASSSKPASKLRVAAILWSGAGAFIVLAISFVYQMQSGEDRPPGLTQLLTPASLFTGVLSCGIICLLNPWMDRVLPRAFRLPWFLVVANLIAGAVFIFVGLRAYWQLAGMKSMQILGGTVVAGCLVAMIMKRRV